MNRRQFFAVCSAGSVAASMPVAARHGRVVEATPEMVVIRYSAVDEFGFTQTIEAPAALTPGIHVIRVPVLREDGFGSLYLRDSGARSREGRRVFA